jgi:hypothetical protein
MVQDMDPHDRTLTLFGWLIALMAGGGILFFWLIGAIVLFTGNGGYIQHLHLAGFWRLLYLAYPVVFVGALLVGAVLVAMRRDLLSVAAAASPAGLALVYYVAMVHLR